MLNSFYLPELAFVGAVLSLILLASAAPASWAWLQSALSSAEER
jgi:hypothetical protein